MVPHTDTSFSAVVLWERFQNLEPKPTKHDGVKIVDVEDDEGNVKTVPDRLLKMRAQRWSNLK